MPRLPSPGRTAFVPLLLACLIPAAPGGEPGKASESVAGRFAEAAADSALERPELAPESATDRAEARIPSEEVCADAGYLCSEVERYGSLRVIHFPPDTEEILVHVPLPEHEPDARARRLREAARQGIRAWSGHPFPIRFVDEDADITLQWEAQLPNGGLGEARSKFHREGVTPRYRVVRLSLATRSPYHADRPLRPHDVELTAAHEMGHALGLPHSDDRADLMYPTDAAKALSLRDFQTVEALYEIPSGARIVP